MSNASKVAQAAFQTSATPLPVTEQTYRAAAMQTTPELTAKGKSSESFKIPVPGTDTSAHIYAKVRDAWWVFRGPINFPHSEVEAHIYRHTIQF